MDKNNNMFSVKIENVNSYNIYNVHYKYKIKRNKLFRSLEKSFIILTMSSATIAMIYFVIVNISKIL